LAALLFVAVLAVSPAKGADAANVAEARLAESTAYLASDELEGRGLGTAGIDRAAEYIAGAFKEIGLQTALFDGTPFQTFQVPIGARLGENNTLVLVSPDGKQTPLTLDEDFIPLALGGSGRLDLPLVFVGYGITAKDHGYDDYAGMDIHGKAVVLLRHEPQQDNPHSVFEGTRNSEHAALARKVSNAYEHGAAAVIFCSTEYGVLKDLESARKRLDSDIAALVAAEAEFKALERPTLRQLESYHRRVAKLTQSVNERIEKFKQQTDRLLKFANTLGEGEGRNFPVVHVRREVVEPAVRKSLGMDLAELERQIDQGPTPHSAELTGWRIQGQISIDRQQAEAKNVLAVLEGQGPHADETLVIGAHYDHLGHGGPGSLAPGVNEIHNGADDNGSGTAALLEVARRLASRPEKLSRRVVFIAFTGEERGLLGSAHYVKNPLYPLQNTIAMLNMDMVGRLRDDKLIVYGTGTSDELEQTLDNVNKGYGFQISKQPSGFGPSDQTSFYAKQVPVLHFFTGIHSDYHRPSDDADKLNLPGMAKIADLVADVAVAIAQAESRPGYKSTGRQASFGGDGDRPYFGSIPDFGQSEPGYALSGVTKDSPAEKAGLQAGDVIIRLGESRIGSLEDFDSALRKHKAGETVPVVVKRADQEVRLEVTLDPPR
jgi:hypothetical protein